MSSWSEYTVNSEHHTKIPDRLDSARAQLIKSNHHYIKTIAEVILLCAKQNLALRGHKESSKSQSRGNFIEILKLVSRHDPIIKEKLQEGPQNAKYTSLEIQNSLLGVLGGIAWDTICNSIREVHVFSLLVDETKDSSKVEQLAIVCRYTDIDTGTIHE